MYHQVTPRPIPAFRKYAVTPNAFAAQMNWLAWAGYVPIRLDALLDYRQGRGTLPSRPIVITFDDGFQDCIGHAVPILQAHGFTAIFFLVAGFVGKTSRWILPDRGIEFPLIDWPAARRLVATGFQCGSHTMNHPHLADLSTPTCRYELLESRHILEDNLGCEVRHLAYPHGSFSKKVQALAAEMGYRSACSVRIGLSMPDDDLLALHRIPVTGRDSLLDFICRLRTARSVGEILLGRAQSAWQRLREAGAYTIP
ncbi:MAG: polysaccharide deacetylase family protein [Acidobacteria bacterium]|nr:polysaccharide deacetylase family protein [Acidobacteriota bacterium]